MIKIISQKFFKNKVVIYNIISLIFLLLYIHIHINYWQIIDGKKPILLINLKKTSVIFCSQNSSYEKYLD